MAVIHLNNSDTETIEYLKNLDTMHKVVVNVTSQADLIGLSESLAEKQIKFKLWIEQPENIPTCIATKPYAKSVVKAFFKNFKLLRKLK